MRGAPARAIQELAGHSELGVTQRYMHLSPALDAAIRLDLAMATLVSWGRPAVEECEVQENRARSLDLLRKVVERRELNASEASAG
jgi:hypothetical protein